MGSPASNSQPLHQHADLRARPSSLPAFFDKIALHNREFVVYDDGWRGWTYSYAEIAQMAEAFATRLRTHGLRKGDHVLIWSESRPGWIAALWACLVEGVVLVPIEPQASYNLFQRIEKQVAPRAILLGDLVPGLEVPSDIPVWLLRDLEADAMPTAPHSVALNEDDVAEIVFTSGTTAEPKGVVMTHRNLAASLKPLEDQLAPYRKYFRLMKPLRVLDLLPMSHLFGQVVAIFLVPTVPASVVFLNTTSPVEIAQQIRSRRITALVSVPRVLETIRTLIEYRFPETKNIATAPGSLIRCWWRHRAVHRFFGWRFCCFVVGGAALPPAEERFWRNLGFIVAQGYGLTETAPVISFNHPFHAQAETAGKPMAGVQVQIAPDGEVLVRGDNVTPGYFQLPAETAAAFQNGWFHTGDIGKLNPNGDLILRGRKKDVIVTTEGLKVFPEDVERELNRIEGVHDSAVIDHGGVHAVLILEPGFHGDDILRQVNQRLEPYQRVRSFSLWAQPELPRTSTASKLRRAEIAKSIQTGKLEPATPSSTPEDLVRKYAPGRTITPDTTLEELGLSSLDRVELMLDLEEKLNISIDDSTFASISKVSDLSRPVPMAASISEPSYNRSWSARLLRHLLLPTTLLPLTRLFARWHVSGLENLKALKGPVIFASNHQSHLDTPIILGSLSRDWRYRVSPAMWMEYFDPHFFPKRYTLSKRLTNSILYCLVTTLVNSFPLSQVETGTRRTLRYVGELVEEGSSILIFPEGERTWTGEIETFYPGVAMIASRMRIPVVPIRLMGADKVLPRHAKYPRPGAVEVRIGAPIVLNGTAYRELAKQIEDAVRAL
jgi:long-chain acyl-CoA synthetase